ncbi:hypothetical protein IF1G_01138 [Cordyceps javanica]|uniref:2EXR domain-containing protein n=1 Tax=Cordyceps javanica TaxID=43265 RepID=A0A545VHK1_9HYPO|nr:hypothetical protein IF1G_01138 [Cordyceps javanica]TQW12360.1 hypothetical protein IF2G_01091 [Cordyceps javanica]
MSTFHLFPRLPTELQCRVWELSMDEPREVIVRSYYSPGIVENMRYLPRATRRPPAPLQACRSARTTLRRAYERVSAEDAHISRRLRVTADRVPYVWVDAERDTVRVTQYRVALLAGSPCGARLRRLAVDITSLWEFWPGGDCGAGAGRVTPWEHLVAAFPGLERLDLWTSAPRSEGGAATIARGWDVGFRRLMEAMYATCSPATLELRVQHLVFADLEPLTRESYGRLFLQDDIAEWEFMEEHQSLFREPRPVAYIPRWVHRDCTCPKDENPGIYVSPT